MMYSSVSIFLHEIFSSLKTYTTAVCLIEPLILQKKIPGAFKHLKDCLKLANCRHLLPYGKYAKNKKKLRT